MKTLIPPAQYGLVVEIGGSKIGLAAVRFNENSAPTIIGEPKIITSMVSLGPEATAQQCLAALVGIAASAGIPLTAIPLISVTIPAPIDLQPDGSAIVVERSNLGHDDWVGCNFSAIFAGCACSDFGGKFHPNLRVYVDNDGKCAGAGVLLELPAEEVAASTYLMLAYGTGVGGLAFVYGRIVRGLGIAGEPGNFPFLFPNEPIYWGGVSDPNNYQIFELYAGRIGLARKLRRIFETEGRFPNHPLRDVQLDPAECQKDVWQKRAGMVRGIADTYLTGNYPEELRERECGLCLALIDSVAEATALFLLPQILILNPRSIIFGGGLTDLKAVSSQFVERFCEKTRQHLDRLLPMGNFRSHAKWGYQFYIPQDGDNAAVIGAADLAYKFWCATT